MKKYKSWKEGIIVSSVVNPDDFHPRWTPTIHIKGVEGIKWEVKRDIRLKGRSLKDRCCRVWFILKFLCCYARWPLKRTAFRGMKRIG